MVQSCPICSELDSSIVVPDNAVIMETYTETECHDSVVTVMFEEKLTSS